MPLHFPSSLYMQATVAVYTSGSIGSSEGDSVSFHWCFIRSTSVIQYLQRPVTTMATTRICLRVGGLDVNFVLKFDVIWLEGVSFLVG
jgi:hypothetical protein